MLTPGRLGASPTYTPYATAVTASSGISAGTAQNAVGPPDGQYASFGGANASLTLDMGEGQEGTGNLAVDLGPVSLQSTFTVAFLNSNQAVITQSSKTLPFNTSTQQLIFPYDWLDTGRAYRYVRLSTPLSVGFGVDSVEKLGYIGATATQDLDGDGIPDRQDAQPLVFNVSNPTPTNPGGGTTNNTTNNTYNTTNGSGGTGGSTTYTTSGGAGGSSASGHSAGGSSGSGPSSPHTLGATTRIINLMGDNWPIWASTPILIGALLAFFAAWLLLGGLRSAERSGIWQRWHHDMYLLFTRRFGFQEQEE